MVSSNELPTEATEYLLSMQQDFSAGTLIRHRGMLNRFYRWLNKSDLSVTAMTPELLAEYRSWCKTDGIANSTCNVELYNTRTYLCWLIRNDRIVGRTTDYFRYSLKPATLPKHTHLFLQHRSKASRYAPTRYRQLLNLFHNWLLDYKLDLQNLTRENILSFLHFLGERGYTKKQLHIRRLYVRIYFDWLRDRDLTPVDCRDIVESCEQFRNFELPDFAVEYLHEIETTLRDKTVISYKTGFQGFHRYLHHQGIDIKNLTRENCVSWMKYMFDDKKYAQSTRLGRLVNLRGYLSWLVEHKVLSANVDDLIRSSDFPKLDLMLPKPLPPKIDIEVQRRLVESNDLYHKGALLLRVTGMRLGELSNLSFDPIWQDDSGRTYIKVPVGKLHSERLVPIEEKTIELIKWMQKESLPHLKTFSPEPEKGKLLLGPQGGTALHNIYRRFKNITENIEGAGSIHPHRLRHTFGTVLINADLHPMTIMVLMGHKDLRMTARYSLITNATVYRTFFQATAQSSFSSEINFPNIVPLTSAFSPAVALDSVTKWLQSNNHEPNDRNKALIIKRLNRIRHEIENL